VIALVASALALASPSAHAYFQAGDIAPNFTKTALGGQSHTLYDYRGKVVVLFLFGYDCPFCEEDGIPFQQEIWQHNQSKYPGQVQVLGADLWNGTPVDVAEFGSETGATYPLLLNGGSGAGNENLQTAYGHYDNYVVISRQGVIRYNAFDHWTHGNRYHPTEIQAVIDSLVANLADVGGGVSPSLQLSAAPNPFRDHAAIELLAPSGDLPARVTVHDIAGRRVATLWEGLAPGGRMRLEWDGRGRGVATMEPGVYVVRAQIGGQIVTRRIVRVR
jgi:peroxiredoxin